MEHEHEFNDTWKKGVYNAIFRRRDIRTFRNEPVDDETMARILFAANESPSVGFMQPWNFIVIKDRTTRQSIRDHVETHRIKAGNIYDDEKKNQYLKLKLEGILCSALNICVTCDTTRGGDKVLGRQTMPETDVYSVCLAIQNLWLAARAEGVGVGWVSILEPEFLNDILAIPKHVVPVAYLCVGYTDDFPERPLLETIQWRGKLSAHELMYEDKWGIQADNGITKYLEDAKSLFKPLGVESDILE